MGGSRRAERASSDRELLVFASMEKEESMEEEEGGRTFAEAEEDDTVASLRFSVCSTDSLQNVRLRSLVRQTSAERTPPISPKQNANCDVRILRVGQEKVPSKPGKLPRCLATVNNCVLKALERVPPSS